MLASGGVQPGDLLGVSETGGHVLHLGRVHGEEAEGREREDAFDPGGLDGGREREVQAEGGERVPDGEHPGPVPAGGGGEQGRVAAGGRGQHVPRLQVRRDLRPRAQRLRLRHRQRLLQVPGARHGVPDPAHPRLPAQLHLRTRLLPPPQPAPGHPRQAARSDQVHSPSFLAPSPSLPILPESYCSGRPLLGQQTL